MPTFGGATPTPLCLKAVGGRGQLSVGAATVLVLAGGAVGGLVGGLIGGAVGSLSQMPPPQWQQLILAVDSILFWSLPTHLQYVQLVPLQFVPEDYKQ